MISVFDIYKIGVGPSSSHTVGPMKAGKQFIDDLHHQGRLTQITKITSDIYGSLSLTGKGHHTDIATILGLAGNTPESVVIDEIPSIIKRVEQQQKLEITCYQHSVEFPIEEGVKFHNSNLSLHENGMQIHAWIDDQVVYSKTYYSIGGGFIVDEENFGKSTTTNGDIPYPFTTADELLAQCHESGLSISTLVMKNEESVNCGKELKQRFAAIWQTMNECLERGLTTEGVLPGPLRVPRRAPTLFQQLKATEHQTTDPMAVIDWVNMYAFAINEENAAGGRVVTAPTNGACGIIPAVLAYYNKFIHPVTEQEYIRYFAASGAIGTLYKRNASISGAEVGCQGEVGVACSMAAAGLAELMGGSPEQVCIAAEIGMEHNLGLTCDPVAGQVQVPCIERNGIAAVKAINSSRMALRRTSSPRVSLDKVIETMLETGKDMNAKYRETSQGGLAIKVIC
ncbi:L-serine ammonia-lyase [Vibrio sp. SS-MA-C1-2]|uniref:L-serine ammonia-lyase n=1 Tax=Vibrio sp. SS-MA-C1-2 TaxID=2908646 RepID=UPI001F39A8FA|nr:L-serine ammonia-lyase [Vibrio sp. SS-MA-C1-2]UJF17968.1 L-serine ammonia-lyase [Vibrio sp. SS-MA-C1-2]